MKWLYIGSAAMVLACGGNPAPEPVADAAEDDVTLFAQVENRNEFDADIFAYRSGRWTRLGVVRAGATTVLPFRWDRPEVQFVIELLGNDAITNWRPEDDGRKTFAADAFGSVPCHLTSAQEAEPGLTVTLVVPPELERNAGGSRCQRRRG